MAARFKDVFNVTWKVVLSLMIVSAIVGVLYGVFTAPWGTSTTTKAKDPYDTSDYHTKMPKSVWDRRVGWAVAHHCHFAGMTGEEIIRALGQPTEKKDYALTYAWQTKDCLRYDGDSCVEYKKDSVTIFLKNGYSAGYNYGSNGEDCHTLTGEHQILGFKVPKDPQPERQARRLAQGHKTSQTVGECVEAQMRRFCKSGPDNVGCLPNGFSNTKAWEYFHEVCETLEGPLP